MNDLAALARKADEPATDWAARLVQDLTVRHQRQARVPVETYMQQLPGLAAERETLLDLLIAEWTLRREAREAVTPAEYVERFPAFAEEITMLWAVDQEAPTLSDVPALAHAWPDWYVGTVPLPAVFGSYRLLREFDGGGMARVFLAEPLAGGDPVALKVPRLLGLNANAVAKRRQRFDREARRTQELEHPRLCRALEVGEEDGLPFFTMPLYPGGSVSDELQRRGPLPEREAAQLIADVARVLQYAHDQRIIHRDLKPSNLLRDADGQVIVTDLGLALSLEEEEPRLSTGGIPGTALYLSPEQAEGERNLTPASDIFTLGVVLYELLAGQRPFVGSLLEVLLAINEAKPPPLEQVRPGVAPALAAICRKAMAREPLERYASMNAFADDLERFLAGTWAPPRETPAPRPRWKAGLVTGALTCAVFALVLWALVGDGTREKKGDSDPPTARAVVSMRQPIGLRGQLQRLHDDLAALDHKDRVFVRYFSLQAVQDNPYISNADLNLHLDALQRVLDRLSRDKLHVGIVNVDKSGCLLRVDLRDLGWDAALEWSDLLNAQPYGVRYDAVNPDEGVRKLAREIMHLTSTVDAYYVRADWFIEAASRAPLYDHLQQIDPKDRHTPPFKPKGPNDPIARVVQLYRMRIDARMAAAELGLGTVAELDARWPKDKLELRQALDQSLSRSQWAGEHGPVRFAECVKMLKLGVPRVLQPLR